MATKIISLDANGGKVSPSKIVATIGNPIGTLPVPEWDTNHIYTSWRTADGNEIFTYTIVTSDFANTIYATWIQPEMTIRLYHDTGESYITVKAGDKYNLPTTAPDGYTFQYWASRREGGEIVKNGDVVPLNAPRSLFAHYIGDARTITFIDGEKKIVLNCRVGDFIQPPTLDDKDGYIFEGWSSSEGGTTNLIWAFALINNNSTTTWYAIWREDEKQKRIITSVRLGYNALPYMDNIVADVLSIGDDYPGENASYAGPFPDKGGTGKLPEKISLDSPRIIFYLGPKDKTRTYTYRRINGEKDIKEYERGKSLGSLPSGTSYSSKTSSGTYNYEHLQWYTGSKGLVGGYIVDENKTIDEAYTWTFTPEDEEADGQSGTEPTSAPYETLINKDVSLELNGANSPYGSKLTLPENISDYKVAAYKEGYYEGSWYSDKTLTKLISGISYNTGTAYYKLGNKIKVGLVFTHAYTSNRKITVEEKYSKDDTLPLIVSPVDCRILEGWFAEKSFETEVKVDTVYENGKSTTLYPKFGTVSEKVVPVKLYLEYGIADITEFQVNVGSVFSALPTPTRKGYEFEFWNWGFNEQYYWSLCPYRITASSVMPNVHAEINSGKVSIDTFFCVANWVKIDPIWIVFNPQGGTTPIDIISRYSGDVYGTMPIPERTGHEFYGWFSAPDGGEQITEDMIFTKGDSPQTLYAHWSENDEKCDCEHKTNLLVYCRKSNWLNHHRMNLSLVCDRRKI